MSENRQQVHANAQAVVNEEDAHIEIDEDDDEGSDPEDKFNQAHGQRLALRRGLRNRPRGHYQGHPGGAKDKKKITTAAENNSGSNSLSFNNRGTDQVNKDARQAQAWPAFPQAKSQRKGRLIQSAHPQNGGWFQSAPIVSKIRLYSGKPLESAYIKFQSAYDPEVAQKSQYAQQLRSLNANTDNLSATNLHQKAPALDWQAPFAGSVTNLSHGDHARSSPENFEKGGSRGRVYTNRRQLKQIYGPRLVPTRKQVALHVSKLQPRAHKAQRHSNLSREDKSRSNSKDQERGRTAMAQKREQSSSKQSLSPIQKVDQYLAELEREERGNSLKNHRTQPEAGRTLVYTQQHSSGNIQFKRLRRRAVQSAKLNGPLLAETIKNEPSLEFDQVDINLPISYSGLKQNEKRSYKYSDKKSKGSVSLEKKLKTGSALEQSMKTMQSSDNHQELAEDNAKLHLQIEQLNLTVHDLEDEVQRILKVQIGTPQAQEELVKKNFDMMASFKKSCQLQRIENHRLLQQISFLKKSKKLTTLYEQAIEMNELTKYCQRQAREIRSMQQHIKSLQGTKPSDRKVEPSVQTLKQHINDYQLILGKEENKIHELQNILYKERTKNKELMSQLQEQEQKVESLQSMLSDSKKGSPQMSNTLDERHEDQEKLTGTSAHQDKNARVGGSLADELRNDELLQKRRNVAGKSNAKQSKLQNDSKSITELQQDIRKKESELTELRGRETAARQEIQSLTSMNEQRVQKLEETMRQLNLENRNYKAEIRRKIYESTQRISQEHENAELNKKFAEITELAKESTKDDDLLQLKLLQQIADLKDFLDCRFKSLQVNEPQVAGGGRVQTINQDPDDVSYQKSQTSSINAILPNQTGTGVRESQSIAELKTVINQLQTKLKVQEEEKNGRIDELERDLSAARQKSAQLDEQIGQIRKMNDDIQLLYSNIRPAKVLKVDGWCQTDVINAEAAVGLLQNDAIGAKPDKDSQMQGGKAASASLKRELISKEQSIEDLKREIKSLRQMQQDNVQDFQRKQEQLVKEHTTATGRLSEENRLLVNQLEDQHKRQAVQTEDRGSQVGGELHKAMAYNTEALAQKDHKINELNALITQSGQQVQAAHEELAQSKKEYEAQLQAQQQALTLKHKNDLTELREKHQEATAQMRFSIDQLTQENKRLLEAQTQKKEQKGKATNARTKTGKDSQAKVNPSSSPGFGERGARAHAKGQSQGAAAERLQESEPLKEFVDKAVNTIQEKSVHFEDDDPPSELKKVQEGIELKEKQLDLLVKENERLLVQGQAFEEKAVELEGTLRAAAQDLKMKEKAVQNLLGRIAEKEEKIKELQFHEDELVKYVEELQQRVQVLEKAKLQPSKGVRAHQMMIVEDLEDQSPKSTEPGKQDTQLRRQAARGSPQSLATFQASSTGVRNQDNSSNNQQIQTEAASLDTLGIHGEEVVVHSGGYTTVVNEPSVARADDGRRGASGQGSMDPPQRDQRVLLGSEEASQGQMRSLTTYTATIEAKDELAVGQPLESREDRMQTVAEKMPDPGTIQRSHEQGRRDDGSSIGADNDNTTRTRATIRIGEEKKLVRTQGLHAAAEDDAGLQAVLVQQRELTQTVQRELEDSNQHVSGVANSSKQQRDDLTGTLHQAKEEYTELEAATKAKDAIRGQAISGEKVIRKVSDQRAAALEKATDQLEEQHEAQINDLKNEKDQQLGALTVAIKSDFEKEQQEKDQQHEQNLEGLNDLHQKELEVLDEELRQQKEERQHEVAAFTEARQKLAERHDQQIAQLKEWQMAEDAKHQDELLELQNNNKRLLLDLQRVTQEQENVYKNSKNEIRKLKSRIAALQGRNQDNDSFAAQSQGSSSATDGASGPTSPPATSTAVQPGDQRKGQAIADGAGMQEVDVVEYEYYEEYVTETDELESLPTEQSFDRPNRGGTSYDVGPAQQDLRKKIQKGERPRSPSSVTNIPYPE